MIMVIDKTARTIKLLVIMIGLTFSSLLMKSSGRPTEERSEQAI